MTLIIVINNNKRFSSSHSSFKVSVACQWDCAPVRTEVPFQVVAFPSLETKPKNKIKIIIMCVYEFLNLIKEILIL